MSARTPIQYVGDDAAFAEALGDALADSTTVDRDVSYFHPADVSDGAPAAAPACLVVEDDPPAVDGLALARGLTADASSTVVVLLGAGTDDERLATALEACATDYIPKGVATPGLVASRIESTMASRGETVRDTDWALEDVLSRVTDAFFAIDEQWAFTYVNERAAELLDRREANLLGKHLWQEFPEAAGTTFQTEYERAMETGDPVSFEEYYPPLETWFEVRAYPSADGLSVYFRDVSDRKARERELERYETIVETVGDGVYVLDEDSRFMMVNDAYCELSGYDRSELLGTKSRAVTGEGPYKQVSALHEALATEDAESKTMETRLPTADGHRVPVRATVSLFPLENGEHGRVGVVRDVSAEKRFERTLAALHESTRRLLGDESAEAVAQRILETMIDVLDLPGAAVYLADSDDVLRPVAHSEYLDDVFGDLSDIEFEPGVSSITRHAYDTGETIRFDDVRETDLTYNSETPLRSGVWIPLADHGVVGAVSEDVGAFDEDDERLAELLAATAESALDRLDRDRARDRRRRQLEALNDVGQELVAAETRQEVCEKAVAAARETLDLPITSIERYDEEVGRLTPVARTRAVEELGGSQLFAVDHDPVWQAYANSAGAVYDDLLAETDVDADETELRSAIIQPLGEHGVLISGATERSGFTEDDVALAEILAANTRAVLDRVSREQTLRERTATLESRTDSLQRLNRVNDLIRTITQSLVQASTRSEIDRAVAEQLVQAEPYEFVWVGDSAVGGESLDVRASEGGGESYLETVSPSLSDAESDPPPSVSALRSGRVHVEQSIHGSPPLAPWRQAALAADFGSAIAVPLTYRDSTYGVLTVYAGEQSAFTEMERTVLGELGEMIGYAINAVERKKALVSESTVELAFAVRDTEIPALAFVQETGATFDFEMLVSESDGSLRAFFTIENADVATITSFADRTGEVADVTHVGNREDGDLFEAVVSHEGFLGSMLQHGAQVKQLTAEGDSGRLVVNLPKDGDVNAFIDMFVSTYDGAELLARRERDQQVQTDGQFRQAYRSRLTERQAEVVRTAFFSGFFEWPRDSTGQDVADMLDVSQPTVNRHIRNAERKLFELVFEDERQ